MSAEEQPSNSEMILAGDLRQHWDTLPADLPDVNKIRDLVIIASGHWLVTDASKQREILLGVVLAIYQQTDYDKFEGFKAYLEMKFAIREAMAKGEAYIENLLAKQKPYGAMLPDNWNELWTGEK